MNRIKHIALVILSANLIYFTYTAEHNSFSELALATPTKTREQIKLKKDNEKFQQKVLFDAQRMATAQAQVTQALKDGWTGKELKKVRQQLKNAKRSLERNTKRLDPVKREEIRTKDRQRERDKKEENPEGYLKAARERFRANYARKAKEERHEHNAAYCASLSVEQRAERRHKWRTWYNNLPQEQRQDINALIQEKREQKTAKMSPEENKARLAKRAAWQRGWVEKRRHQINDKQIPHSQPTEALQHAQQNHINDSSTESIDFDALLTAYEYENDQAFDLDIVFDLDAFDNDSAMQLLSEGNFFGAGDLREHYNHLLIPQQQAAARVQARRRSSDARAQQLTQRRLLPSSDTSDVEEFDDSTVSTDPREAVAHYLEKKHGKKL